MSTYRIKPDHLRQRYTSAACRGSFNAEEWDRHIATAKGGAVNSHEMSEPERLLVERSLPEAAVDASNR
jgi:hypothetical protein